MRQIWNLSLEDYEEIVKRSKEKGLKPGESMEDVLFEYVQEKGIKPCGNTELNEDEFIAEISNKNNVLNIKTDKDGKTFYDFHKKNQD